MRLKILTPLASAAVILFTVSATGYAHTHTLSSTIEASGKPHSHSRQQLPIIAEKLTARSEGLQNTSPEDSDRAELNVEIKTVAEESASSTTAAATSVSNWLEKRVNEENVSKLHSNHSHQESEFLQDEGMEVVGGGWCNNCGCWMRHGCDPNGNCNISHASVCGSGNCSLHPLSSCFNSN